MTVISDRTLTIDLAAPITNGTILVNTVVVNPPTIGARRKAEGHLRTGTQGEAGTKFQIALVASCTGLPDPTIEQMDADVFNQAWDHVMRFLVPAQETTSL